MTPDNPFRICTLAALTAATLAAAPVSAKEWIFQPAVGLDQRFDDNFTLVPVLPDRISATRLVGDLGLGRQTATTRIEGILRADVRVQIGDDEDSVPSFNGLALFDVERKFKRARANLDFRLTQDSPSQDVVADVTDRSNVAVDNGLVTQSFDIQRLTVDVEPSFSYDLSRRSTIEGRLSFTNVSHETPSPQDAIFTQYQALLASGATAETNPELFDENGDAFTRDTVSIDQTGVFSPAGELDDFQDAGIQLGYRFQLSRRTSVSATVAFSRFVANEEVDGSALDFDDLIPDSDEQQILRAPRRDTVDTTTSLTFGLRRAISQTTNFDIQIGAFTNSSDDTELFLLSDGSLSTDQPTETDQTGFLGNISFDKDAGLTKYSARFAFDVQPSSTGSRVQTAELSGEVFRTLSPRLEISLRGSAFEPDQLGALEDDAFARRFISVEPRVVWRFTRSFTFGASYRYRRQRAEADNESSESNALLFSVRFNPPSRLGEFSSGI